MDKHESKSLADLERQADDRAADFARAGSAESFSAVCQRLRQSAERYKQAAKAADAVRAERKSKDPVSDDADLISRARRASLGIPTIDDLRRAIFKGGVSGAGADENEVDLELQLAEEEEARARNAYSMDLDRFSERSKRLKALAVQAIQARKAYEAARSGEDYDPADDCDAEHEAVAELAKLPALEGLEDFYVPR